MAWGTVPTLMLARGLRALADGYVAILLPAYLLSLGLGVAQVGLISSATLLGSALATLALGAWGHRWPRRRLLSSAAILMALTGLGFALADAWVQPLWPLLILAFVGTLNPSAGDVSVFLPLEHSCLADAEEGERRTRLFAYYSVTGSLCAAAGALLAGLPAWCSSAFHWPEAAVMRGLFVVYGLLGGVVWWLYRRLPTLEPKQAVKPAPLGPSRSAVLKLAALFSLDAFAGGLVVNALLSLWLMSRFGLSLATAGLFFFWSGLLTTASQWLAPYVARRLGLLQTMVFTHLPANVCLILAASCGQLEWALAWLLLRSALSQMDVPTRSAFVMSVVTPAERTAAASFTAVPRSLASALSPSLAGALFALGWLNAPLLLCGVLKIIYDLSLLRLFRRGRL